MTAVQRTNIIAGLISVGLFGVIASANAGEMVHKETLLTGSYKGGPHNYAPVVITKTGAAIPLAQPRANGAKRTIVVTGAHGMSFTVTVADEG